MTNSINQPWAICDEFVTRYGQTWADIDFVVNGKISVDNFKSDPLNCEIGSLHVCNHNIAHEVAKLTETISDALATVIKSYELGLYL